MHERQNSTSKFGMQKVRENEVWCQSASRTRRNAVIEREQASKSPPSNGGSGMSYGISSSSVKRTQAEGGEGSYFLLSFFVFVERIYERLNERVNGRREGGNLIE